LQLGFQDKILLAPNNELRKRKMKRLIIAILFMNLINSSNIFAVETKDGRSIRLAESRMFSFAYNNDSSSLLFSHDVKRSIYKIQFSKDTFATESFLPRTNDSTAKFSLAKKDLYGFSFKMPQYRISISKNKKDYLKAAQEVVGINAVVWAYDKFILNVGWADISLRSIHKNFKDGFDWDANSFLCNQFEHPYHGAMYYSAARINRLNFFESTIYTFLGSLTWELFWEVNRPSTNDVIMTTLGGIILGETLFRIADLVFDESSSGFERAFRKSLAFLINPAFGFKIFTGKAFQIGNLPQEHYYNLEFPFGVYYLFMSKPYYVIATHLEYKEAFKNEISELNPYDWFLFDFRLGINDEGFLNKEIYSTGLLFGKKVRNGLAGLFGVFDYVDSRIAEKVSAVGVGPGFVTNLMSDSNLFLKSSGVLSVIFGGSSSSLDLKYYHFGNGTDNPYYLGPGMLGRIELELGKKGLGSFHTGFSQYWVHSIFTRANEFLSVLSLNLKYDLSNISQISVGYEHYLRHATQHEQRLTRSKNVIHALYVIKF